MTTTHAPLCHRVNRTGVNMAFVGDDRTGTLILYFLFLSFIPVAEAFDGGDAVALLLGVTISIVGFCACIGWYARRRNGQF
ncbi:small integral membrane protein 30-like [Osmerus mordax]|uniref:small integral membrane protein 30-like n=1 Tax=Osmerus mordax TaxID=8014 RepID=UPI00350FB907